MKGICAALIPQKFCGSERGFTKCRGPTTIDFSTAQESGEKLALLCFTNKGPVINPFRQDGSNQVKRVASPGPWRPPMYDLSEAGSPTTKDDEQLVVFPHLIWTLKALTVGTVLFTQDQEKSSKVNPHKQVHENRGR